MSASEAAAVNNTTLQSSAQPHAAPYTSKKSAAVDMKYIAGKLMTKEDPIMIHKTLGILALASFVYRYLYLWPATGTLGMEVDALSAGTMLVHLLLSFSSIIFKVPRKRVAKNPTMIWEEYKLHAIVFTMRCVLVYALGAAVTNGIQISQIQRVPVVLSMHVLADAISIWVGQDGNTTVRGNGKAKMPLVRRLSLAYASYQFFALGSHLVPHARTMDFGYNTLIAIQSSAFAMTLNRKGIITWRGHAVVYGVCLFISLGFILLQMRSLVFILAVLLVFVMRIKLNISKYVLWASFAIVYPVMLQQSDLHFSSSSIDLETQILGTVNISESLEAATFIKTVTDAFSW